MAALPAGVSIVGPSVPGADAVLTPDALAVVADLQRRFGPRRDELLAARAERQRAIAAGADPDFLAETRTIRASDWRVAGAPPDLDDRRVEITGPAEPKMMINALNSGARVFMADLEDALSPTWANVVGGQAALRDAVRRTLALTHAREALPARRADRDPRRPAARLAPRGAPRPRRRAPRVGEPVRRRAVPRPQRRRGPRARERAVPLPRQAREPPRGAPLERRVHRASRRPSGSRTARSGPPS